MQLEKARATADYIVSQLQPFCSKIEVAGSIRRRKSWVNDIDIVCIPSNQGRLGYALAEMGNIKMGGGKLIRVDMESRGAGIDLDLYVAAPETWATLLLIRTGSAAHNRKLCGIARIKGMILHADGSGLFRIAPKQTPYDYLKDERIAGDTETSIFENLGLPYVPPEKREV